MDQSSIYNRSPEHAVPCERVAVARAVARPAAVLVEAPVAHHAPVAVGSAHPGLADAVSVGRVAEGAVDLAEGHRAQRVAAARWGGGERQKIWGLNDSSLVI